MTVDNLKLPPDELQQLGFEAAQDRLEQVVAELEAGNLPLERSLALYELGLQLRDHCRGRLAAAEAVLERLKDNDDGSVRIEQDR